MQTWKKENTIFVRISLEHKNRLKNKAGEKGMSLSAYCRVTLLESLETGAGKGRKKSPKIV